MIDWHVIKSIIERSHRLSVTKIGHTQRRSSCTSRPETRFESGELNRGYFLQSCICENVSVLAVAVHNPRRESNEACSTRADEIPYKRDELSLRRNVDLIIFDWTRDYTAVREITFRLVIAETVERRKLFNYGGRWRNWLSPCYRTNQTDLNETQNARNAKSENRNTMNKLARIWHFNKESDCQVDAAITMIVSNQSVITENKINEIRFDMNSTLKSNIDTLDWISMILHVLSIYQKICPSDRDYPKFFVSQIIGWRNVKKVIEMMTLCFLKGVSSRNEKKE